MLFLHSYVGQPACQPARAPNLRANFCQRLVTGQRPEARGRRAESRERPVLDARADYPLKWQVERRERGTARHGESVLWWTSVPLVDSRSSVFQAVAGAREVADESIRREMPLKIRLTPMSVPIAQPELTGQCAQIRIPSRSVIMASTNTQPDLAR